MPHSNAWFAKDLSVKMSRDCCLYHLGFQKCTRCLFLFPFGRWYKIVARLEGLITRQCCQIKMWVILWQLYPLWHNFLWSTLIKVSWWAGDVLLEDCRRWTTGDMQLEWREEERISSPPTSIQNSDSRCGSWWRRIGPNGKRQLPQQPLKTQQRLNSCTLVSLSDDPVLKEISENYSWVYLI